MNGVLGQGVFERRNLRDEFAIAQEIGAPPRILPVNLLVYHLVLAQAIEHQRGVAAIVGHTTEQIERRLARQKISQIRCAILGADKSAVIDDHRQRTGNQVGDGPGEVKAAAGHEGDFDAASDGSLNGAQIGVGQPRGAVEQRAVDVERNQADGHGR